MARPGSHWDPWSQNRSSLDEALKELKEYADWHARHGDKAAAKLLIQMHRHASAGDWKKAKAVWMRLPEAIMHGAGGDLTHYLTNASSLPDGFEGFDTEPTPENRSAMLKRFEAARKGQPFRLGSEQYEVRVNHGYVSDVPGMPRGSRGYMVLVFDAKMSPQERAAAKGGGTTTLVLDTATDKVYVYPWSTTRTDSRGTPKGKPARVVGRRTEMNSKQEKDILRTLVKAGHETLAKRFAVSRGYRVKGATTAALDDHDKRGEWNIHVYKSRPTRWDFFVKNPQGGGGGSSSYKSAQAALTVALRNTDFKGAKRVWVVIAKWNAEAGDYDVTKSYWHTL